MEKQKSRVKPIPKPKKGDIEIIPGEDFFKNFDPLSEVIFMLRGMQSLQKRDPNISQETIEEVDSTINFLKDYIEKIIVEPVPPPVGNEIRDIGTGFSLDVTKSNIFRSFLWRPNESYQIRYIFRKGKKKTDELNLKLANFIKSEYIEQAMLIVIQRNQQTAGEIAKLRREKEDLERKLKEVGKDRLHKQPRYVLKTVAQRISNTTDEPTLFTLPQKLEPGGGAIGELKEEISKNTVALAFYLIQKYQENNSKTLEISNLNSIAEVMNCNNYRLKLFLLYLGGYTYPMIDRDETTKELIVTNEQLFKIEFRYSQKVADKYSFNKKGEIQGAEFIGTKITNFIKDEPVDRVIITPSQRIVKALEGRGLGNILTVNNNFVGLILELTDIATKILTYSASNKPSHKIAEDNLVKHLGLTKQIKTQGRPRIRATILKGLSELQEKGHIKSYAYEETTGVYSYTYSDKYIRYKDSKKGKKEPPEGVQ